LPTPFLTIDPTYTEAAAIKEKAQLEVAAEAGYKAAVAAIAAQNWDEANRQLAIFPPQSSYWPKTEQLRAQVQASLIDQKATVAKRALEAGEVERATQMINDMAAIDPMAPQVIALREELSRNTDRHHIASLIGSRRPNRSTSGGQALPSAETTQPEPLAQTQPQTTGDPKEIFKQPVPKS